MSEPTLLLGSTGLIGSACKRRFSDHNLLCPSRQELDLLNEARVNAYFAQHKPTYVILAAGLVGGIHANKTYPADFITTNLKIVLNVFTAANNFRVKRLLFFASSCMYPKVCPQPMFEELMFTGHLEPTSLSYAVAKLAGMQMARAFNQQTQTDRFAVLIPNTVYGPNGDFDPEKGHVISVLIARFHQAKCERLPSISLWGTGTPRREFIFADDVASAAQFVLNKSNLPIPLNVGIGYDVSIKELADLIAKIVGYEGKVVWDSTKPDGAERKLLDSSKLMALGWKATVDLEGGIKATYEWYKKHEHN